MGATNSISTKMDSSNLQEVTKMTIDNHCKEDSESEGQSATQSPRYYCNDSNSKVTRLRVPQTDTKMTDWGNMNESSNSNISRNQSEPTITTLSRIILQLATTNQQLASTHNKTVEQFQDLYVEFKKQVWSQHLMTTKRFADHDVYRNDNAKREDELNKKSLKYRISRLERILLMRKSYRRKTPWRRKFKCKTTQLGNLYNSNSNSKTQFEEFKNGTSMNEDTFFFNEPIADSSHSHKSVPTLFYHDKIRNKNRSTSPTQVENETRMLPTGKESTVGMKNNEILRLKEEIERLKTDRCQYQDLNQRLLNDLADQKMILDQLQNDCKISQVRYEEAAENLKENSQQFDQLTTDFKSSQRERERLLKELDISLSKKDTAEARIVILEQDLERSTIEKELIRNTEVQKTCKLKAQLSEEMSDKEKQVKALEEALNEIQRLKEVIKTDKENDDNKDIVDTVDDPQEGSSIERSKNMEDFKKELTLKREARQRAIATVSSEMDRLRRELNAEKEAHSETTRVLELLKAGKNHSENGEEETITKCSEARQLKYILKVSDELRNDIRFQIEKVDDLRYQLENEPDRHQNRITYLTDMSNRIRGVLNDRDRKASELKDSLAQVLVRFSDQKVLNDKDEVGAECDRQLENINTLKLLYKERLRVLSELKDNAVKELADTKDKLEHSVRGSQNLENELKKAEEKIDAQDTEISNLESQLGLAKADCRDLQNQMSLINGLFTQMLLGASSADMDLDRLTRLLQENHDLISGMAREEGTEAAALPKLLLDIVEQVEGRKGEQNVSPSEENQQKDYEVERKDDDLQEEDIAHNLPKVWRVLLELLSCHVVGTPNVPVITPSDPSSCYKSVDTPAGPRLVISVSKTYIRLKELILEKKHLEKEMNRMKQLNVHLESRLGEQEKKLSTVSDELNKTWNIVGRMQAQHQQLHTHEKILRYELQQKRKMLQELKQELEYCKEKWEAARQKNTNTEIEWRSLRREFAARKALAVHDSLTNSGESGFSDERGDDTDEEDEAVGERIRIGARRRTRKENSRVSSPDTESEQPTDTDLSESKPISSVILDQRTATPESEGESEDILAAENELPLDIDCVTDHDVVPDGLQESLDPLDQALTNVIQDLIITEDDEPSEFSNPSSSAFNQQTEVSSEFPTTSYVDENNFSKNEEEGKTREENCVILEDEPIFEETNTEPVMEMEEEVHVPIISESENNEELSTSSVSIFTIGPFPASPSNKNVQFSDPLIIEPSDQMFPPIFGVTEAILPSFTPLDDRIYQDNKPSGNLSSNLETVEEVPFENDIQSESEPCSSTSSSASTDKNFMLEKISRTPEEVLAARADRLKRLEEQAEWLMKKMCATNRRGLALNTRLEVLHEAYGEPPVPPPMPDVLPSQRLQTASTNTQQQSSQSEKQETKMEEDIQKSADTS